MDPASCLVPGTLWELFCPTRNFTSIGHRTRFDWEDAKRFPLGGEEQRTSPKGRERKSQKELLVKGALRPIFRYTA